MGDSNNRIASIDIDARLQISDKKEFLNEVKDAVTETKKAMGDLESDSLAKVFEELTDLLEVFAKESVATMSELKESMSDIGFSKEAIKNFERFSQILNNLSDNGYFNQMGNAAQVLIEKFGALDREFKDFTQMSKVAPRDTVFTEVQEQAQETGASIDKSIQKVERYKKEIESLEQAKHRSNNSTNSNDVDDLYSLYNEAKKEVDAISRTTLNKALNNKVINMDDFLVVYEKFSKMKNLFDRYREAGGTTIKTPTEQFAYLDQLEKKFNAIIRLRQNSISKLDGTKQSETTTGTSSKVAVQVTKEQAIASEQATKQIIENEKQKRKEIQLTIDKNKEEIENLYSSIGSFNELVNNSTLYLDNVRGTTTMGYSDALPSLENIKQLKNKLLQELGPEFQNEIEKQYKEIETALTEYWEHLYPDANKHYEEVVAAESFGNTPLAEQIKQLKEITKDTKKGNSAYESFREQFQYIDVQKLDGTKETIDLWWTDWREKLVDILNHYKDIEKISVRLQYASMETSEEDFFDPDKTEFSREPEIIGTGLSAEIDGSNHPWQKLISQVIANYEQKIETLYGQNELLENQLQELNATLDETSAKIQENANVSSPITETNTQEIHEQEFASESAADAIAEQTQETRELTEAQRQLNIELDKTGKMEETVSGPSNTSTLPDTDSPEIPVNRNIASEIEDLGKLEKAVKDVSVAVSNKTEQFALERDVVANVASDEVEHLKDVENAVNRIRDAVNGMDMDNLRAPESNNSSSSSHGSSTRNTGNRRNSKELTEDDIRLRNELLERDIEQSRLEEERKYGEQQTSEIEAQAEAYVKEVSDLLDARDRARDEAEALQRDIETADLEFYEKQGENQQKEIIRQNEEYIKFWEDSLKEQDARQKKQQEAYTRQMLLDADLREANYKDEVKRSVEANNSEESRLAKERADYVQQQTKMYTDLFDAQEKQQESLARQAILEADVREAQYENERNLYKSEGEQQAEEYYRKRSEYIQQQTKMYTDLFDAQEKIQNSGKKGYEVLSTTEKEFTDLELKRNGNDSNLSSKELRRYIELQRVRAAAQEQINTSTQKGVSLEQAELDYLEKQIQIEEDRERVTKAASDKAYEEKTKAKTEAIQHLIDTEERFQELQLKDVRGLATSDEQKELRQLTEARAKDFELAKDQSVHLIKHGSMLDEWKKTQASVTSEVYKNVEALEAQNKAAIEAAKAVKDASDKQKEDQKAQKAAKTAYNKMAGNYSSFYSLDQKRNGDDSNLSPEEQATYNAHLKIREQCVKDINTAKERGIDLSKEEAEYNLKIAKITQSQVEQQAKLTKKYGNYKFDAYNIDDAKRQIQNLISDSNATMLSSLEWSRSVNGFTASVKTADGYIQKVTYHLEEAAAGGYKVYEAVNKSTKASGMWSNILDVVGNRFKAMLAYLATFASAQEAWQHIKTGAGYVADLNKQLTEMRKVSDESIASLRRYQKETFAIADAVGSTASQIQSSTADYLRLGRSMEESAELARNTNLLMNISEFEDINEATEAMVAMTQAYQELSSMEIIDKLNTTGEMLARTYSNVRVA